MLGRLGYFFICFLWLLQSSKVLAVSNDKKPILIICSYNPAAHQTSVTKLLGSSAMEQNDDTDSC